MSQVARQSEVGNHKRRTLNTRLSSGTSAGTFAVSTGPYINFCDEAGTKNEPDIFCTSSKKGSENRSHVSNLTPVARLNFAPPILRTFPGTLSFRISFFRIPFYCVLSNGLWSGFMNSPPSLFSNSGRKSPQRGLGRSIER